MRCHTCNRENRGGARFCLRCGAELPVICPQCGTGLPPGAAFCDACGARVRAPPPEVEAEPKVPTLDSAIQRLVPAEYAERLLATRGQVSAERRVVTILFSDVKGSTAMAEDLDPEDVMEIMDGAFDLLIEPVYRYEGTLARLMGDAVLAFFGAPLAHEDDAQRACLAALDILSGAQDYAARLEGERGITGFNVRVGIHTGLVVVGEVGSDLRVEYTAMGDAVNLAARLESAAEPGTVLVSEATHKRVAPLFETEALGPIQVKGRAKPVAVYRVLAQKDVPGKVRDIAGLESPLVGRETELAALREAVERLQTGCGGIVTIVGEAGIGKSRLVAETLAKVGERPRSPEPSQGLQWVEGRCLSYGTSIAYLLWLDVLRGLLGVTIEDGPEEVGQALAERVQALCPDRRDAVFPYLARMLSLPLEEEIEERVESLAGKELRDHTFAAAETLLACTAREQPLVVVCEDLHWADPTSLQVLEGLFPLTDRLPLLFVCVFRPVREHPVWQLRERLAGEGAHAHTDLCLEPLSAADSQALVTNLLWMEDLPPALKARILARAEGNPFYLEEILRSLIDQGAIVRDPVSGRWQAMADVERIAIPDTLEGVLVARIDRLQEETRRVLQLASVIGRIFLYRVLAEIAAAEAAAYEELALDRRLATLQREELIRERARLPELEYIFKHDLTREAAYKGLLRRDRRAYHRQVAEALERLFPERIEEQVGLLAHHWERAGDAEKAVEYLQRAGDQARLAYAHEEAVDYYERALAFLREQGAHEQAARTLMKLGLTHHNAFDYARARQAHEAGFALWQEAGEQAPALAPPPAPHALRVHLADPATLDPALATYHTSGVVIDHLFSGLLALTPELGIEPDVARSWEVAEGGRRYRFHLRDDVVWSDGVPVTAGDFEYAWKRALDPATGSPTAGLLYDIAGARLFHQGEARVEEVGVKAVDEGTLEVDLEGPAGYFLLLLANEATYPVPRHLIQDCGGAWAEVGTIVTNGPFRLASWRRDDSMVLSANPAYHGPFWGNVGRVELALLTEDEWRAQLEGYEAGRLDALDMIGFPTPELDRVRQRHPGEYITGPLLSTAYNGFDASRPPFDDVRVRRAFVMATDRAWLADVVMGADFVPATGGFVPPGMPGHVAGIGLPFDPEQAQALLAEAGYPGGRGFPSVDAVTITGSEPWGDYPEAFWREHLGVEIHWETLAWAPYFARMEGQPPHLFGLGWVADYPDPDNFLRVSMFQRYTRWRNRTYDELVQRARRSTDQTARMELYAGAEQVLVEEAAILPLSYQRRHLLVKPWLTRYPTSAMRSQFWKDVVIEPH